MFFGNNINSTYCRLRPYLALLQDEITMASVYKSLSKSEKVAKPEAPANGVRKNKQRVLMLTSRGVTHRCELLSL